MTTMTKSTFEYTYIFEDVDSSLIDTVAYNLNSQELGVVLHGDMYVYSNVPISRYYRLVNASSKGSEFQTIKRDFGPSVYWGSSYDVEFKYGSLSPSPAATPKGLVYAEDAQVTTTNHYTTLTLTSEDSEPEAEVRKHRVNFVIDGDSEVRNYNVDAANVDEAVEALTTATEALGINVRVVRVVTFFE